MDPEPRKIETSVHDSNGTQVGDNNIQINNGTRPPPDLGLIGRSAHWKAARKLRLMDVDEADQIVAAAPEKDAAEVLRLLCSADEDFTVALVAEMHPARARALIEIGEPDLQRLRDVPAAAEAISRVHDAPGSDLGKEIQALRRADTSPRGTVGFFRVFERAEVHWSDRYGTVPVVTGVADVWWSEGGSSGRLGFPVRAREPIEGSGGFRQHFEFEADFGNEACASLGVQCGATIYQTPQHGTFVVEDAIGDHYEENGSVQTFGFPTGPEVHAVSERRSGTGGEGWIQPFEKGSITLSEVGSIAIMSPVREHYEALDGVHGRLGFPRGKAHVAGRSPQGTDGRFQRFQGAWDYPDDLLAACIGFDRPGGATIYTSVHGTHKVDGGIGILYERMGGTAGWLGFPVSVSRKADERRRVQAFEGGAIYWSPEHDAVAARGDVLDVLGPDSEMGFPTHPEQLIAAGPDTIQFFEHGLITRRANTLAVWRP